MRPLAAADSSSGQPAEQRFIINGVSWEQYERLRELLDQPGLRMTYLEGVLELMSPSRLHEQTKTIIARLLEAYALQRGIALNGYGSTTFRKRAKERGLEPDECYMVGAAVDRDDNSTPPHIAIEVALTSGGIDKLAVYSGLEVGEVWFWDGRTFGLYGLQGSSYIARDRSRFLPELDLALLATFIDSLDQTAAVREYLSRLAH
jgi:Uma2 family endonuclease